MTPEEIKALARHYAIDHMYWSETRVIAFAAAIEAATIERLAKIVDERARKEGTIGRVLALQECADAIRALATKEG